MRRVGVDIGGTFTDLILVDDDAGAFTVGKALTTPDDPSRAVETVLVDAAERHGVAPADVDQVIHGTTLVTNAIIERKGAPHGAARRRRVSATPSRSAASMRYDLYDLFAELPRAAGAALPALRGRRADAGRRLDAARRSTMAFVERLARELAEAGIEAVAICFLHSYANPAARAAARAAVLRVAPKMRDLDLVRGRAGDPRVRAHVDHHRQRLRPGAASSATCASCEARLRARRLRRACFCLMLSSGGIATVETAPRFPVRLLESGPAAGALAAAHYGALAGVADLLSFDMGGTTAKFVRDRRRRAADAPASSRSTACTASRRAAACRSRSR